MFYRIALQILRILFTPVFLLKTQGRGHLPKQGGFIVAANHRSNWDVIMLALACPRPLNFMAKKELFENRFLGALISHLNAFPISRGLGDVGAVKTALARLKSGKVLLLFPEGKRVKSGQTADAKAGVAMMSIRAKVPVVPAAIIGAYKPFKRHKVIFGEPISFEEYYHTKPEMEVLVSLSDGVLNSINKLKTAGKG